MLKFLNVKRLSKVLFISLIAVLCNMQLAWSQAENVTLVSGTLYNSITKEPIQTTIFFIDEDGKEIKAGSEINGQYQAVLKSGKNYVITAKDYLIPSDESDIILPANNKYSEIRKNLEMQRLEAGLELFAVSAFDSGQEILNSEGLAQILKLKSFLQENLKVKVKIYFSAEDTYLKASKKKVTETNPKTKKKKTKIVSISVADQLNDLIAKRKSNISDILTSLKIRENRYTLQELLVSAEKPIKAPKAKKKGNKAKSDNTTTKFITMKIEIESIMKF